MAKKAEQQEGDFQDVDVQTTNPEGWEDASSNEVDQFFNFEEDGETLQGTYKGIFEKREGMKDDCYIFEDERGVRLGVNKYTAIRDAIEAEPNPEAFEWRFIRLEVMKTKKGNTFINFKIQKRKLES